VWIIRTRKLWTGSEHSYYLMEWIGWVPVWHVRKLSLNCHVESDLASYHDKKNREAFLINNHRFCDAKPVSCRTVYWVTWQIQKPTTKSYKDPERSVLTRTKDFVEVLYWLYEAAFELAYLLGLYLCASPCSRRLGPKVVGWMVLINGGYGRLTPKTNISTVQTTNM
jgi:hypothetical protein